MKISLALSGGGFRASTFSQGTIQLLKEVGLLENVHIISSVSGGTITATMYALYGADFKDFNNRMNRIHTEDQLLEKAHEALKNGHVKVPSKRENIITAFAEAYDQEFYEGKKFGDLWDGSGTPEHLEDIIFNATEFKTGTGFRFQKTQSGRARIGNGNVFISLESAKKIRLADIMASSSCFSAGFEPLSLPYDFKLDQETVNELGEKIKTQINKHETEEAEYKDEIALMDGGIYDNQGIESVLLANERRDPADQSDIMLIVDVASAAQDIYDPPVYENRKFLWAMPLKWVKRVAIVFGLILWLIPVASIILNQLIVNRNPEIMPLSSNWINSLTIVYGAAYLITSGLFLFVLARWNRLKKNTKKEMPTAYTYGMKILRRSTLGQLKDMIEARIGSVVKLSSEIFLKRSRSQVYEDAHEHDSFKEKTVVSILKHFNTYEERKASFDRLVPKELHLNLDNPKHRTVLDICIEASQMPTTLWFKNDLPKKDKIVAAGAIISCYTLIKYLTNKSAITEEELNLIVKLKSVWQKLVDDPYCIHRSCETM